MQSFASFFFLLKGKFTEDELGADESLKAKVETYNQRNSEIMTFFQEKKYDTLVLDSMNKQSYEAFEDLRLFIEKDGRPFNYLESFD